MTERRLKNGQRPAPMRARGAPGLDQHRLADNLELLAGLCDRADRGMHQEVATHVHAPARVAVRAWPVGCFKGSAFVPKLRLSTSAALLRRYGEWRAENKHGIQQSDRGILGDWVLMGDTGHQNPISWRLHLHAGGRPVIGPVNADAYIPFLLAYRTIVERHGTAIEKIRAIKTLRRRRAFDNFYDRHVRKDPLFPASRFHLTLDTLTGVGTVVANRLSTAGFVSIVEVALANPSAVGRAGELQLKNAEQLVEQAQRILLRAMTPASGERLGPRSALVS